MQMGAVLGTYFLAKRYFGSRVALTATFLYAVNPWAVTYARKIWTQSLLPLFVVLFFAALLGGLVERRRHGFTFASLWLVVLCLLHPQAVALAPLLLWLAVVQWRREGPVWLLPGVGLGLLVASPYLYDESQRGFSSLFSVFGAAGGQAQFDLTALSHVFSLATGAGLPDPTGSGLPGVFVTMLTPALTLISLSAVRRRPAAPSLPGVRRLASWG